jgi:hypothetical protein
MADTSIDILRKWIEKTEGLLIDNYNTLGLKASGEWERSIYNTVIRENMSLIGTIFGKDYTEYMVKGRPPNEDQDDDAILAWVKKAGATFLKDWVRDKGLQGRINSYAVAWKIAKEGVKVPNVYNKGTLLSAVLTDSHLNDLKKQLTFQYVSEFKSRLLE